MLLVVTPGSLSSDHVRAEWQRAQQQGKRIIGLRFGGGSLPPDLQDIEVVDFRGVFDRALEGLITRLAMDSSRAADQGTRRSRIAPRLPPLTAVIAVVLAAPCLFPLPGRRLRGHPNPNRRTAACGG
jgi:hypothetical protein